MTRLAVAAALSLLPACTIVVAQQSNNADDSTSDDSASSFPEPPVAESSTAEPVEDLSTSTGEERDDTSTGAAELGDTTTGEASTSSSTGADDLSTSTSTETTGADASTSEALPVGKALAEPCALDEECNSGACIGGGFNDIPRCSMPCSVDAAADCLDHGYPGLCTYGGGDAHWCTGAYELAPGSNWPLGLNLRLATPDPDMDYIYYQSSDFLQTPIYRSVYLVPALQAAFYVEFTSVNDPGYGSVVVDVHSADGTLIGTYEQGDNPSIEPMGVNAYHWLVVRPASDQKALFQLHLKAVCWPNCG